MRKSTIVLPLLSGLLLLSGCGSSRSSENLLTPHSDEVFYSEALGTVMADVACAKTETKIEADLSIGESAVTDFFDPAGKPADSLGIVSPSADIKFTLPDVVKGPLVTKNSNGVSEYFEQQNFNKSIDW